MNLTWIKYLPILFSVLKETVEAVEAVRGPGNGSDKKDEVLDVIRVLATALFAGKEGAIIKWAGVMIDVIVLIYNARGTFQKAEAPAVG